MKQAIHTSNHTNTRGKQRGWRRYRGYIILPFGIGAFLFSCINGSTKYDEIEYNPFYYYDTPVDWPIPDDAIGGDTAQAIYEWFYVESPLDNHLAEDEEAFLPKK